jgi:hypothetical protein
MFLLLSFCFSSTKLESRRVEQVLQKVRGLVQVGREMRQGKG